MEQVKKIVRQNKPGTGARLTNLSYQYRGTHADFKIKDITPYRITAKSEKALRRVINSILEYKWKKEHPIEERSIYEKPAGRPGPLKTT